MRTTRRSAMQCALFSGLADLFVVSVFSVFFSASWVSTSRAIELRNVSISTEWDIDPFFIFGRGCFVYRNEAAALEWQPVVHLKP